jgi:hypothetical protein
MIGGGVACLAASCSICMKFSVSFSSSSDVFKLIFKFSLSSVHFLYVCQSVLLLCSLGTLLTFITVVLIVPITGV